jgi:hypothetical protein
MRAIQKLKQEVSESKLFRVLSNSETYRRMEELEEEARTMSKRAGKFFLTRGDKVMQDYNSHIQRFSEEIYPYSTLGRVSTLRSGILLINRVPFEHKLDSWCMSDNLSASEVPEVKDSLDDLSYEVAVGIGDLLGKIEERELSVVAGDSWKCIKGSFVEIPRRAIAETDIMVANGLLFETRLEARSCSNYERHSSKSFHFKLKPEGINLYGKLHQEGYFHQLTNVEHVRWRVNQGWSDVQIQKSEWYDK